MLIAGLFLAAAVAGAPKVSTGQAWILRCQVDSATQATRTFRVAPKVLQEWRPGDKRFGPNLCETFSCKVDRDKLEGSISSASLILTLRVDQQSGQGSWSTLGASGLKQTSGPCAVERDKPKKPG
jgi:hypothetical protein